MIICQFGRDIAVCLSNSRSSQYDIPPTNTNLGLGIALKSCGSGQPPDMALLKWETFAAFGTT